MKSAILLTKLAITAITFAVLFRLIDLAKLREIVSVTNPVYFAGAILVCLVQFPLVGIRWGMIMRHMAGPGVPLLPQSKTQQITWIALFIGQVMPFVAGDAVRVLMASEAGVPVRISVKSVLLDRAFALLLVFAVVLPGIPLGSVLAPGSQAYWSFTAFVVLTLIGAATAMVLAPFVAAATRHIRVLNAMSETLLDARNILTDRALGSLIVGLCVLIHALSVTIFWLLARGQAVPLGIGTAAVIVPMTLLVTTLPISISGWGVREAFLVTLLGSLGIGVEDALLLSVSFGATILVATLPGAVAMLFFSRTEWACPGANQASRTE